MRKISCDYCRQWDTDESVRFKNCMHSTLFPLQLCIQKASTAQKHGADLLMAGRKSGPFSHVFSQKKFHELREVCLVFNLNEMLKEDRMTTLTCYKCVLKNMENWTYSRPAGYRESGFFVGICYRKNKPVDLGNAGAFTQCCSNDSPALHFKSYAAVSLDAM